MGGAGTTGDVATEQSEPPKASPAVRPQLLPARAGGRAPLSDPAVAPSPCPRYRHLLLDVAEHLLPLLVEPLLQLALRTLLLLLQHPQLAELLAPKGGASWGGRGAASLEKAPPQPQPPSTHRAERVFSSLGPALLAVLAVVTLTSSPSTTNLRVFLTVLRSEGGSCGWGQRWELS